MSAQPLKWPTSSEYIERIGSTIQYPTGVGEIPFGVPLLVVSHSGNILYLEGPDKTDCAVSSLDVTRPGAFINRPDLGKARHETLLAAIDRLAIRRHGSGIQPRVGMRLRRTDAVYFGTIPTGIEVTVVRIEDDSMFGETLTLRDNDGKTYKFRSGNFTDKFFTVLATEPTGEAP